ncbi:MAG: hypothetical protein HC908_16855 [Calothrix sp. SM1_7_51]|nr:hypothetical protein [Calothrix sp. SM1_7_51]
MVAQFQSQSLTFDPEQARKHLEALGYNKNDKVYLRFIHSTRRMMQSSSRVAIAIK